MDRKNLCVSEQEWVPFRMWLSLGVNLGQPGYRCGLPGFGIRDPQLALHQSALDDEKPLRVWLHAKGQIYNHE